MQFPKTEKVLRLSNIFVLSYNSSAAASKKIPGSILTTGDVCYHDNNTLNDEYYNDLYGNKGIPNI